MNRLEGKNVVVTGSAQGNGEAVVRALAAAGARVIATDIQDFSSAPDPHTIQVRLDVRNESDWMSLCETLRRDYGVVHGLVNNAGIVLRGRLDEISHEDVDQIMAVNLVGPILGIQAVSPLMTEGGSIVNIGSLAGMTAHTSAAYTASKWAIRGISRVASVELGPRRIRVNCVAPGFIETPMTADVPDSFRNAAIQAAPLARTGQPEDVANLVVFLISDESSFISGVDVPVDGGMWGHGGTKIIADALHGGVAV